MYNLIKPKKDQYENGQIVLEKGSIYEYQEIDEFSTVTYVVIDEEGYEFNIPKEEIENGDFELIIIKEDKDFYKNYANVYGCDYKEIIDKFNEDIEKIKVLMPVPPTMPSADATIEKHIKFVERYKDFIENLKTKRKELNAKARILEVSINLFIFDYFLSDMDKKTRRKFIDKFNGYEGTIEKKVTHLKKAIPAKKISSKKTLQKEEVAKGVRVKFTSNWKPKSIGEKHLSDEDFIYIADSKIYNDESGSYIMIKGSSKISSGYEYLEFLELEFPYE